MWCVRFIKRENRIGFVTETTVRTQQYNNKMPGIITLFNYF